MQSWKQCALPVITTMALWQLMHQCRRHRGGQGNHGPPTFLHSKKKKGKQRKKRKSFRAETIKRLLPRSKCYCFSCSRASRTQTFFLSANCGGRQFFSVFHGPSTLKFISPALCTWAHDVRMCHKVIVVITERVHCFHDCIYITLPILLLWDLRF